MQSFAASRGFPRYVLTGRFLHRGRRYATAFLSNYDPEWIALYRSKRWAASDPILRRANSSVQPFAWSEVEAESTPERRMAEAALRFGIADGCTIPLHAPTGEGISLFLAGTKPPPKGPERDQLYADSYHLLLRLYSVMETLLRPSGSAPELSERERQVLTLIAAGSPVKVVARDLGISDRTVSGAINSACAKLRCASREQAIVVAASLGLISWIGPTRDLEVEYLIGS